MYRLVIIENCKYNFKHNKQINATINHAAKAKQQQNTYTKKKASNVRTIILHVKQKNVYPETL